MGAAKRPDKCHKSDLRGASTDRGRPPSTPGRKSVMEEHDNKTIRCGKLGHEVNFKYCRIMNNRLPCSSIVGCWQMQMDINKFLEDHYSKEELDQVFTPPKPKIESLVELIEKAKKEKTGR